MDYVNGSLILIVGTLLYFFPFIVALVSQRRNVISIGILNLFLGWTFVFWVLALVWAFKVDDSVTHYD